MTDIIKALYAARCAADLPLSEECLKLIQEDGKLWEKVKPLIGREAIDELLYSSSDIAYQTNYEWFREGFRLGAGLMLELL